MKKTYAWYDNYPDNPKATNLSMVSGAARLLTILLIVGAILTLLGALMTELEPSYVQAGFSLLETLDEIDDEVQAFFLMVGGAVICSYVAGALRQKARFLGDNSKS